MKTFWKSVMRFIFGGESQEDEQLLDLSTAVMTEEEAMNKGRAVAAAEGWSWPEPVVATLIRKKESGRKVWSVTSDPFSKGMDFHVIIDDETKEVLHKSHHSM